DIGVSREVKIDAQSIGVKQHPGPQRALNLDGVLWAEGNDGQRIGDSKLLEHTPEDPLRPCGQIAARAAQPGSSPGCLRAILLQLNDKVLRTIDGTGGVGR